MVNCGWRQVWIVWPLYLFSFWTSLTVWFTGCIGFPRSCFTGNPFPCRIIFTPSFRFGKVHISWFLFVATSFPVAVSIKPPKCASCSCAWELDAASDFEFLLILLPSFPVAMSIPGLLDAIRLFADEEIVGTWEDKFLAVDFDFATLLSSCLCSCIRFAVQLIKLEF